TQAQFLKPLFPNDIQVPYLSWTDLGLIGGPFG
ncbi:unnamed protein product, partial [marine sediment metagenome]